MEELVAEIERSFEEVERQLNDPNLYDDPRRAADLGRQHKQLRAAYEHARRWRELRAEVAEAGELAEDSEPEIREMARQQRADAESELPQVEEEIRLAMLERDPNDDKDVIVEIRP